MGTIISTVTSKWQITIPEDVRKEIALKVGQRIVWEVEGDKLVGRRVRSVSELAGCLKVGKIPAGKQSQSAMADAAVARHNRLSRPKS